MNRLIIAIMALVLGSVVLAVSAAQPVGYAVGSHVNASIITIGVNSSYSNTTSQQALYSAESYLSTRLGQSYFNKYVSYYGAASYGNVSYVYFTYFVPFANGTSAMAVTDMQIPHQRLLGITVFLNGANVTGYIGPSMPYFAEISPSQALNISNNDGIEGSNATIEGVFNSSNITSTSTYSVAWAVIGTNPLKNGIYQGAYIDVMYGNVIGEYEYSPSVASSNESSAYAYGSAGDFSMFYMQAVNQSAGSIASSSTDSQYILPLTILAFAMLGVFLYLSRRQQ